MGVIRTSAAVALALSFLSVRGARADEPPAITLFRGGPERTGSVTGSHLPEHPAVRWTTKLAGFPGEALLVDGVVYVGDMRGILSAIKLEDGAILWRHEGRDQIFAAPARRGGTIYFTSRKGLTALAREDGRVLWTCGLVADATSSSPLIVNDRIVVADARGDVSAVGLDGKPIWQHDIASDAPPDPPGFDGERARIANTAARPGTAASDGTAVFLPIFDQSRIAVIDLKAGRRRWSYQAKGWIWGEPTVTEDRVFFGSQDRHLYCLDKRRKTLLWSFPASSLIQTGVGYRDGSVFFGSFDGHFYRLDATTGREVWTYTLPGAPDERTSIYSAPLCTEDAIYFGAFDGYLYRLEIGTGALKWRIRPAEGSSIAGSPLTDGRRIVVGLQRSRENGPQGIVAIDEGESREKPVEGKGSP